MKISLSDKKISRWNMKISLREKKISPWNMIISPWDMKIQNFLMWFKNGLGASALSGRMGKTGFF